MKIYQEYFLCQSQIPLLPGLLQLPGCLGSDLQIPHHRISSNGFRCSVDLYCFQWAFYWIENIDVCCGIHVSENCVGELECCSKDHYPVLYPPWFNINRTFPPSQVHWCVCTDSLPSYAAGHDPVWDNLLGVSGILFRCFLFCASWWGEIYWCTSSCAILWKCFIWKWKQHDYFVFTKCNIHYKFEHLSLWNTVSQTGCHLMFVLCIWGEPKWAPLWWVYVCTRMLGLKMT